MKLKNKFIFLFFVSVFPVSGCGVPIIDTIAKGDAVITELSFSPDKEKFFYTLQISPQKGYSTTDYSNWVYNTKTKENNFLNKIVYAYPVLWSDNQNIVGFSHTDTTKSIEQIVTSNINTKQEKQLLKSSGNVFSTYIKENIFYFFDNSILKSFDLKSNSEKDIIETKNSSDLLRIKAFANNKKILIHNDMYSTYGQQCPSGKDISNFTIKTSLITPKCNSLYILNNETKSIRNIYNYEEHSIESPEFNEDGKYIGFIDIDTINVIDSDTTENIYNKKLDEQLLEFTWIDNNNFAYNSGNKNIVFHNLKENTDKTVNLSGHIRGIYQNKLLVTSESSSSGNLSLIDINDLSVKKINSFSSKYIDIYMDKNLNQPVIEESITDSKKVNIYTLDKNNELISLAKINLLQK